MKNLGNVGILQTEVSHFLGFSISTHTHDWAIISKLVPFTKHSYKELGDIPTLLQWKIHSPFFGCLSSGRETGLPIHREGCREQSLLRIVGITFNKYRFYLNSSMFFSLEYASGMDIRKILLQRKDSPEITANWESK